MTGPPSQGLTINGVEVDLAAGVLRDRHGVDVPMRRQAFAVLRHLLGNPGRVVGKEELMAAVWPGIAVTDDSLVQCIHEIRRALRDESAHRASHRAAARLPAGAAGRAGRAEAGRRWRTAAAAVAAALLLGGVAAGGASRRRFRPGFRLPCCPSTISTATRDRCGSPPPSPRI